MELFIEEWKQDINHILELVTNKFALDSKIDDLY